MAKSICHMDIIFLESCSLFKHRNTFKDSTAVSDLLPDAFGIASDQLPTLVFDCVTIFL